MNTIHDFYQLQKDFKFCFHGIHLNRVMIFELHCLSGCTSQGLYVDRKLTQARRVKQLSLLHLNNGSSILSTFGEQDRKDHYEVYDYVTRQLNNDVTVYDLRNIPGKKSYHFITFIKSLFSVFLCCIGKSIPIWKQIKFAALCTYYCNCILELEKADLTGIKKYLSMYNATEMENLITQFMKIRGIPTFSLCEGIYVVEKEKPTLDSVNYTNLETDHLLTWGQWVNDEFAKIGIEPSRMTACGYPHNVRLEKFKKRPILKRCMVLLARGTYHNADVDLLNILIKTMPQYHYDIKCHPVSNIDFFESYAKHHGMGFIKKEKTVNECLDNTKYDFAIAVNTSAYYEALMRGIPCLRFTDGSFTLMKGYNDIFTSYSSYISVLEFIKNKIDDSEYQSEVDNMLTYVMGVGENKYKSVLLENN